LLDERHQSVNPLVVLRAVDVQPQRFSIGRKGMAVGAGGEVFHHDLALGLSNTAQPPLDEADGAFGQRADHASLADAWDQRYVAIEDRRAHGIFRGLEVGLALRDRLGCALIRESADRQRGWPPHRLSLDRRPRFGIRLPRMGRSLGRSQPRKFVLRRDALRVDFADAEAFAFHLEAQRSDAVPEGDFDAPDRGSLTCVAPEEGRRRHVGWVDSPRHGRVHGDAGRSERVLRASRGRAGSQGSAFRGDMLNQQSRGERRRNHEQPARRPPNARVAGWSSPPGSPEKINFLHSDPRASLHFATWLSDGTDRQVK
jgi:hypothetical protein